MSRVIPCCALFPEIEPGFFDFADDLIQPHVLMQDLAPVFQWAAQALLRLGD